MPARIRAVANGSVRALESAVNAIGWLVAAYEICHTKRFAMSLDF